MKIKRIVRHFQHLNFLKSGVFDTGIVPNLRHKVLLDQSLEGVLAISHELNNGTPLELIAIQLQDSIDALGQILGATVKVDVLDQIFSRFCIGK